MSIFSYIYHYSTASTSEAAYIIGGLRSELSGETIAEYKSNVWRHMGTLKNRRSRHGSISLGDEIMIIGGGEFYSQD